MPELFATEVPRVVTAVLLCLIGGAGNFFQAKREGKIKFSFFDFIAELTKALSAGLASLYFCQWKELPEAVIFLAVLLAANNSSEVLAIGREQVVGRIKAYVAALSLSKDKK